MPLGASTCEWTPRSDAGLTRMAAQLNPATQQPLMKKGLLGRAGRGGFAAKGWVSRIGCTAADDDRNMISPTDNMLSPCSAKLSDSKKRHFQKYVQLVAYQTLTITRGKPIHLASQLSSLASSDSSSSLASAAGHGQKENQLPKAEF